MSNILKNTEALDKDHKIRYKVNQNSKGNIYWSKITVKGETPEEVESLLKDAIMRLKKVEREVNE